MDRGVARAVRVRRGVTVAPRLRSTGRAGPLGIVRAGGIVRRATGLPGIGPRGGIVRRATVPRGEIARRVTVPPGVTVGRVVPAVAPVAVGPAAAGAAVPAVVAAAGAAVAPAAVLVVPAAVAGAAAAPAAVVIAASVVRVGPVAAVVAPSPTSTRSASARPRSGSARRASTVVATTVKTTVAARTGSPLALLLLSLGGCAGAGGESAVTESAADTAPEEEPVLRGALAFRFPLLEVELFEQLVGVDHDPAVYDPESIYAAICTSYDGRTFPWCYDEHDGSDYLLEGGFDTMDAGSATIVAAAPGVVVEVEDGHYDRCHADTTGIDCDGHDGVANRVIVEHEGGWRTLYWHMMQDSAAVEVGEEVQCGTPLGKVGSSGYSSTPHLHFELQDAEGLSIDPYAGAYSQPETWWVEQGGPEALPAARCAEEAGL